MSEVRELSKALRSSIYPELDKKVKQLCDIFAPCSKFPMSN